MAALISVGDDRSMVPDLQFCNSPKTIRVNVQTNCPNLLASRGSIQECSKQAVRAPYTPDARELQLEPVDVDPRRLKRSDSNQSNSVGLCPQVSRNRYCRLG